MTSALQFRIDQDVKPETEIGMGNLIVFSGYCYFPGKKIERLSISVASHEITIESDCDLRPELIDKQAIEQDLTVIYSGFWSCLPVSREMVGQKAQLTLHAQTEDGKRHTRPLGQTEFIPLRTAPTDLSSRLPDNSPLVAICLCTYEPIFETFERQVNSIIEQTYDNWICLINDDCSTRSITDRLRDFCNKHERFYFARNESNIGYYSNFEECLRRVPAEASYVALCDQDDYWYPTKLERLLTEFDQDTMLVYSDMQILGDTGDVISPSYWLNRKNEHKDLAVLLVANTVTGAASMFRRELVELLLPFPLRVGDAFHDHWIACVALSRGSIDYVDEALYDYYQHGESVIGHCDFTPWPMWKRIWSFLNIIKRLCIPGQAIALLTKVRSGSLGVYHYECRRLELVCDTIRVRGLETSGNRRALDLFGRGLASGMRLLLLHAKVLIRGKTTDDAELRLALGYFVKLIEDKRIVRQKRKQHARDALNVPVS